MNTTDQLTHIVQQGCTVTIKESLGAVVVLVAEPGRQTVRGRQLVNTNRIIALGRQATVAGAIENAYILTQREKEPRP